MYKSIRLTQFRSYESFEVELGDGVNIVVGPNGSGKTNLLESLYVLSVGSTFRGAERDLIKHHSEWYRVEGLTVGGQKRVVTCRQTEDKLEKQFLIDEHKRLRLMAQNRLPVVLFEPDHLRLLAGSPTRRRDFLDGLLARLVPDYSWLKHQLDRTLLQRNNVLKSRLPSGARDDQLFVWDIKFSELAAKVVSERRRLSQRLNSRLNDVYSGIAGDDYQATVGYHSSVASDDGNYQQELLKKLKLAVDRDQARGFTSVGPHRDDLTFEFGGRPAASVASRGEVRSLLLALKMVELELMEDHYNTSPLLLLDDVFSELDATRRKALTDLAWKQQTIITTTDGDDHGGYASNVLRLKH